MESTTIDFQPEQQQVDFEPEGETPPEVQQAIASVPRPKPAEIRELSPIYEHPGAPFSEETVKSPQAGSPAGGAPQRPFALPDWKDIVGSAYGAVTNPEPTAETATPSAGPELSQGVTELGTPGKRVTGALRTGTALLEGLTPLMGPAALENPANIARGLAEGYAASEATGYGAKKLGASTEQQELAKNLAFWAPGVARSVIDPRVKFASTPEATAGTVEGFGGRARAGVAITPEEVRLAGKVGPYQGSVGIPRGPKATTSAAIESPTIEGQVAPSSVPVAPPPSRADLAHYLDRAGWDPDKARALFAQENPPPAPAASMPVTVPSQVPSAPHGPSESAVLTPPATALAPKPTVSPKAPVSPSVETPAQIDFQPETAITKTGPIQGDVVETPAQRGQKIKASLDKFKDVPGVSKAIGPTEVVKDGNTYEYKGGHFLKNGEIQEDAEGIVEVTDALEPQKFIEGSAKFADESPRALPPAPAEAVQGPYPSAEREQPTTPEQYKYGSTQANIPDDSAAANALETARQRISPGDLAGKDSDQISTVPSLLPKIVSRDALKGHDGMTTTLNTAGGNLPARYKVVEAADLLPSHNAHTFGRNANYPWGIQERTYDTSKEAQARVIQQTQNYDPSYTINTNPDAVNGPPVITPDGTVLGGNSRAMSTQRLYKSGKGKHYKSALVAQAPTFGLNQEAIRLMKEPVLIREVAHPETLEGTRRLAADLNKSMTGALGVSERAVSAGKSITPESLSHVAAMMDDMGSDTSLRELMRERGRDLVAMLVKDGAITERERPQFVDTASGGLSEEGKTFVERALLGSVVDDPRLMDSTPKAVLNKLDSSLAALSSLSPRTDAYNILPLVRSALHDHAEIAAQGSNVETFLNQVGLFGEDRSPAVDAIVRLLAEKSTAVKQKLRQFAHDAAFDVQGQATLGLMEPPGPAISFNEAFGTNLSDEELADSIVHAAQAEPIIGGGHEAGTKGSTETNAAGVQQRPAGETRPGSSSGTSTPAEGKSEPKAVNKLNLLGDESGSFDPGTLLNPIQAVSDYLKTETQKNLGARELQSGMYDLESQYQADVLRAVQTMQVISKQLGAQAPKDFEQIYHHMEDPKGVVLNPTQQELLRDIVTPFMTVSDRIYQKLTDGGVPAENYVHRVVKEKGSWFDRILDGSKSSGRGNLLSKSAPQTKGRTMFALESDGERRVVSLKGGQVTAWKHGIPENLGPIMHTDEGKAFEDKDGRIWHLAQATTKEIERHTDLEYHHNALASALVSYLQLRKAERGFDFIESFKNAPEFSEIAQKQGEGNPPAGWKQTDLPQLRGYFFEPHTAEVLDWYSQKLKTEGPGVFDQVGAFMRTAMLINPLFHPMNVAASWGLEKGVTGFMPWNWFRMGQSGVKAIRAVTTQNDDFLAALDAGAPLQSQRENTNKLANLFFEQLSEGLKRKDPAIVRAVKAMGFDPDHFAPIV
jgi:hypothetical protein